MPEIPLPNPHLADATVALRPWRQSDLAELVGACQDPEIPRWTAVPAPYGEREAREYLGRAEVDRRSGRELGLAVVDPGDSRLLGSCGLARFDWQDRKVEVGYWVAAPARRRSVGSRSTLLLSHWAISALGMERVELLANPANEASQRLAERAGFTREGLLRDYRRRKGEREDLIMFSLLAGDLEHSPPS
jgi:ribosomal-protein-alanine N-acetyltransferase